ncbi:MAG: CBS domain-containing protein, partial [Paracoccaceae bacterium]
MPLTADPLIRFLESVHPYDRLPPETLVDLAPQFHTLRLTADARIFDRGDALDGLFLIESGEVEITGAEGMALSLLGPRNSFGERGLMRDGTAVTSARTTCPTTLLMLPIAAFHALRAAQPAFDAFFIRTRPARTDRTDLSHSKVGGFMSVAPLTCAPDTSARTAAHMMAQARVSSLCVMHDDQLKGIVTLRDLSGKVLGAGLPADTPVSRVMTHDPMTLPPSAIGSDVLHMMLERHIGHVPITEAGRLVGIVTQTDLTRVQAVSAAGLVADLAKAPTAQDMARVTAQIPQLLVQLVAGGARHEIITRLITDVAD